MSTSSEIRRPLPPAFEPIREIGHGAASVVHEATQRSTGRAVAVKVLTLPFIDTAVARRFAQECAMMAALAAHPNIVTLLDANLYEERPWIAMELCRGSFAAVGPLTVAQALDVLIAVAEAMDAAHRLGILHCDLKPSNILITDFGAPAVADFGVARHTATAATAVGSGYSLEHAAPEVLDGHEPTPATDVYCLGSTIWTLLAGRSPYRDSATTPNSTIAQRILLDPFPPLPVPAPPPLAALIDAMTARAPADRVATMAEVAGAARGIREGLGPDRDRPVPGGWAWSRSVRGADDVTVTGAMPRRALLARLAVLGVTLAVALAGVAVAVGRLPTRPVADALVSAPAPPTTVVTPTPVVNTLGLPTPESNLPCDGSYVVIVGSAVTPGRYAQEVAWLLSATPGTRYLRTSGSCGSFSQRTRSGALVYAVYLGPFPTLAEACAARSRAPAESIILQLSGEQVGTRPRC